MQNNSYQQPEQLQNKDVLLITAANKGKYFRRLGMSICGAFAILLVDVVLFGSSILSLVVCPIWFIFSMLKNAIQRPGWRLALIRIAIPVLTLGLVLVNDTIQYRIAESNTLRIIAACEEFNANNGKFPHILDELVPQYLPSIPRTKYCLVLGEFRYWNSDDGHPILVWYVIPPYGRNVYDFGDKRWNYLD
jgi:hypothetical protein